MNSAIIRALISEIPDFTYQLDFFFSSFDHITAQRDGVLEMTPGSFLELDNAKANILEWERKFDSYLKDQEIRLKYSFYLYSKLVIDISLL